MYELYFSVTDGSTSLPSVPLKCGEQQIVQNISFIRIFVLKCTDTLSDSSFKNFIFFIAKTVNSVLGDACSLNKLQPGDLIPDFSTAK